MRLERAMILGLVVLLWSCSERNVYDETGSFEPPQPAYGKQEGLKGLYSWGFEISAIHLCNTTRDDCLYPIGAEGECWVEFTEAAYRQLEELRGDSLGSDDYGQVWLEGSGRVTKKPGNFGHMSDYGCQVELGAVHVVSQETPRAFQPPPP